MMKSEAIEYQVTVPPELKKVLPDLMDLSRDAYFAIGIVEGTLAEGEIDDLLGDSAYCGGVPDVELLQRLEKAFENLEQNILFYFSSLQESNLEGWEEHLHSLNLSFNKIEIPLQDWNIEWKKHFTPIHFGEKLQILPVWEQIPGETPTCWINPAMGFGTGHHETTWLCLDWLVSKKRPIRQCLDFGCGSGILGLSSLVLNKHSVDFVDIDGLALNNARDNYLINLKQQSIPEQQEEVNFFTRDKFRPTGQYDLIFANILLPVLLEEKNFLIDLLAPRGQIVLSGILVEQLEELTKAYKALGLTLINQETKQDWARQVYQRV